MRGGITLFCLHFPFCTTIYARISRRQVMPYTKRQISYPITKRYRTYPDAHQAGCHKGVSCRRLPETAHVSDLRDVHKNIRS
ncbi:hypothetical protein PR003_g9233 [Phytophthora rubi]|uniref:Uncharacterized protein n=1 Tax=Phytophthora rubi TaxID=129364 RepID=A0A6A4F913_9STRA|nr:hypothetical protein PR002_g9869 [Phytophthora rubi]KAE9033592.1 hypothetical protein PR001_g10090 [Phytophthora rubi]KAE9342910.1 hypothetical protein PR003_g9233 [Phytophthora rubi]